MARILDEFPASHRTKPSPYPWTEWADGQPRVIEEGKDYTCKPGTLVSQAAKYAKNHGLKVKTAKHPEGVVLWFVGHPESAEVQAEAAA